MSLHNQNATRKKPSASAAVRKDIVAKADSVIQFKGDVFLIGDPHIIHKGLQGKKEMIQMRNWLLLQGKQ